jgi:hypothetical protein
LGGKGIILSTLLRRRLANILGKTSDKPADRRERIVIGATRFELRPH